MEKKLNRRNFLKFSAFAVVVAGFFGKATSAFAQMVDTSKGMAKTLKYVDDGAKVAKEGKMPAKYKDGQSCANCQFYKKVDDKKGNCTLVKPGFVAVTGWCTSYNLKKS